MMGSRKVGDGACDSATNRGSVSPGDGTSVVAQGVPWTPAAIPASCRCDRGGCLYAEMAGCDGGRDETAHKAASSSRSRPPPPPGPSGLSHSHLVTIISPGRELSSSRILLSPPPGLLLTTGHHWGWRGGWGVGVPHHPPTHPGPTHPLPCTPKRWAKFSSRPSADQTFSLAPLAPISLNGPPPWTHAPTQPPP